MRPRAPSTCSGGLTSVPCPEETLTLARVARHFPLQGRYCFRLRTKLRGDVIFQDIIEPDQPLKSSEGRVVLKANRLSWPEHSPTADRPVAKNATSSPALNFSNYFL